jgi:hypothetical protein
MNQLLFPWQTKKIMRQDGEKPSDVSRRVSLWQDKQSIRRLGCGASNLSDEKIIKQRKNI